MPLLRGNQDSALTYLIPILLILLAVGLYMETVGAIDFISNFGVPAGYISP